MTIPTTKNPLPSAPTTTKEFLRWATGISGLGAIEMWTGLVSYSTGLPLKIPYDPMTVLLIFVGFLLAFGLVDNLQRGVHLNEQEKVAQRVVASGEEQG